jgi:cytochrome c peroxidase
MQRFLVRSFFHATCLSSALLLAACGGGGGAGSNSADGSAPGAVGAGKIRPSGGSTGATDGAAALAAAPPATPGLSPVDIGSLLFKDKNLSASRQMACASCHAETFGHADAPGTLLPLGGAALNLAGMRSSPTVRYQNEGHAFRLDAKGEASGGFTWDRRADSRKDQARDPFFVAEEMALPGSPQEPSAVTQLVRQASYFPDLQALYAPGEIDSDLKLFDKIAELLETYQREDTDYNRFDSKYDQSLAGLATLTAPESRGLAIMADPKRGNCMSCHTATGSKPLFTNFGYAALGVPRNHAAPKNVDPNFYDLGLCSRAKSGPDPVRDAHKYCGQFKTPTLRNVERTAPYFHNASVASLEDAVRFHFERDAAPAKWFKTRTGAADQSYNDLPVRYRGNLARQRPFSGDYRPSDGDIADILAFLKTLNDADQTTPLPPR